MDFRQIKQFVVLATELNYRKAAERLHMTSRRSASPSSGWRPKSAPSCSSATARACG